MNETIESNVWRETTLAILFFWITDTDSIYKTLITSFVSHLRKCVYFREITHLTREAASAAPIFKGRLVVFGNLFFEVSMNYVQGEKLRSCKTYKSKSVTLTNSHFVKTTVFLHSR